MLGSCLKRALEAAGVTEERVSRWLGAPCGCEERRKKLDALDAWARRVLRKGVKDAVRYLEELTCESE